MKDEEVEFIIDKIKEFKWNLGKNMGYSPLVYVLTLDWNGKQITIDCVESVLMSNQIRV